MEAQGFVLFAQFPQFRYPVHRSSMCEMPLFLFDLLDKNVINLVNLQIFENIFPCAIITPLDCFWEGSKLLGPDLPVTIP